MPRRSSASWPWFAVLLRKVDSSALDGPFGLGGHVKTGHRGSLQNRPTGRGQDLRLLYRVWGRRGKRFLWSCFLQLWAAGCESDPAAKLPF